MDVGVSITAANDTLSALLAECLPAAGLWALGDDKAGSVRNLDDCGSDDSTGDARRAAEAGRSERGLAAGNISLPFIRTEDGGNHSDDTIP